MTEEAKKAEESKKVDEKKAEAKKPETAKPAVQKPEAAKPATQKPEAAKPAAKKPEEDKKAQPAEAKSGKYYPNKIGHIYLKAMEDVMGKNGLHAILRLAKLNQFIDNMPPADLKRQFDFTDYSALNAALEDMYGPRGGRGLAMRAGRASFAQGLKEFGALAGVGDKAFKILPLKTKLKVGVSAMAKVFSSVSDQKTRVEDKGDHFLYIIEECPVCWDRKSDKEICHAAAGVLQEGLRWVSGGNEFRVGEIACHAKGDENCVFKIEKEPIG